MGIHNRLRKDKNGDPVAADTDAVDEKASQSVALSQMDVEINQEIPIDDPTQVVLHKEMFIDVTNEKREIRLSMDFLDFNFAESGRFSESKHLTVTNKYPFSVDVNWALLNVLNQTT